MNDAENSRYITVQARYSVSSAINKNSAIFMSHCLKDKDSAKDSVWKNF